MASYQFFDTTFYLTNNPDVAASWPGTAADHYFQFGAAEGRAPVAWFDFVYYRSTNPDLANMTAEQLFQHYNVYGYLEGRVPSAPYTGFDGVQYLADNPDVAAAGYTDVTALSHFLVYGQVEGRVAYNTDGEIIVGTGSGDTFTLTTGIDNIVGSTGNDTINAFVGEDNNGNDASTMTAFDTINGGAGIDTLDLLVNYDYTNDATMSNVEIISARIVGGTNASIDFANITGVTTVEVKNTNSDYGYVNGWNVSDEISTYKFTNVARQSDSVSITMEFNNDVFTGSTDEISVVLNNAGNSGNDYWANLYLDNNNDDALIEVVNVESNGSDNQFYYSDDSTSVLNTINVTGVAALNLEVQYQTALTAVNAEAFDAGLTFVATSTKDMVIATGAGDDVLAIGTGKTKVVAGAGDDKVVAGGNLATGDLLDGGDGDDTLGMTSAAAVAASALTGTASADFQSLFSNFEVLSLSDNLGVGTIDVAKLDGMQTVVLNGHDAATINGLTSGATIEEHGNATWWMTANVAGTGAADVLNVKLVSAGGITEGISSTGVETVNVVTTDTNSSAHSNSVGLDVADATSVTISGNTGVGFFSMGNNTKITNFDASGVSGAAADAATLAVFFASENATTTATVSIQGGSGNDFLAGNAAIDLITGGLGDDNLSGGAGNDTLSGGAGADILAGGAGKDAMTGGAGADVFAYTGPATDSNGTTVDLIADFVSGTDKFDTTTVVTYAGEANGYGAVLTSLTGVVYQGVLDTSTSNLYIDVDGNAILDSADMVITLTGVTDLAQADVI